jgi:hypothetical protein
MSAPDAAGDLDPEDTKIVMLARATRARVGAAEGAAVRDNDHRTYTAATVDLDALRLTALQAAVAAAVSAGTDGLAAAAVVTDRAELDPESLAAVRELGASAVVFVADAAGRVRSVIR